MWFHRGYEDEDQYSEDEEEFCERCGRDSHSEENCFATFDIDGRKIYDQPSPVNQMSCNRCGYPGHVERNCFATYSVDGRKIFDRNPFFTQRTKCRICGSQGHSEQICDNINITDEEEEEIQIIQNDYPIQFIDSDEEDELKPDRKVTVDQDDPFFQQFWYFFTKENVDNVPNSSGVYELSYSRSDMLPVCVYVGHSGNLQERLLDHLFGERISSNGTFRKSNLRDEKIFAEANGCHFSFRYLLCKSKGHAECLEQSFLSSYNYFWNLKDNDKQERIMVL
jgi:hypothetical protein